MAVLLFIERAAPSSLDTLHSILDEQSKALADKDINRLIALDSQFHLSIAQMTGNTFLQQQLASIHDKVMLVRGQVSSTTPTWSDRVIVEHARILSALSRSDAAVAEAEMRYHLSSVVRLHLGMKQ